MRIFVIAIVISALSSCTSLRASRGMPEKAVIEPSNLFVNSYEQVTIPIDGNIAEIFNAVISKEKPSSAVVKCNRDVKNCRYVKHLLHGNSINFDNANQAAGEPELLVLDYNHLGRASCNSLSLGCSVSYNVIGMVPNHNEFINPIVSDFSSANDAINAINSDNIEE